ncbi:MAG: hypothetical protein ACYDAS_00325 [Patescibacteria group bacterium]
MYEYSKEITIKSTDNIDNLYNEGFVFVRKGKGVMQQIRSLRLDLKDFKLTSENRRILKKTENISIEKEKLPYNKYNYNIHRMGFIYYKARFGDKIMTANKIKEMFTNMSKSNMNSVFVYKDKNLNKMEFAQGYALSYINKYMIHYSYPFYDLSYFNLNMGICMMLKAIIFAKEHNLDYVYLGSVYKKESIYKLQFKGLSWFDGEIWNKDIRALKEKLT